MNIEKAEIEKVLSPEGVLGGMIREFLGSDPSMAATTQFFTTVPEPRLSDEQQFGLVVCFNNIDHWLEQGSDGEKAYHSILGLLRAPDTGYPDSSADPEVLSKLAESVDLLLKHQLLNKQSFKALIASKDPIGVATALRAQQLAPEDVNRIIGIVEEPVAKSQNNAEEVMPVDVSEVSHNPEDQNSLAALPPELKEHVISYLPSRDQNALLQTEHGLRAFFDRKLKDKGGIKAVVVSANTEFTKFFNILLRSKPDDLEALLKPWHNYREPSYDYKDQLGNQEDVLAKIQLTQLLIHVVKGDIEHAEAMLKEKPELLLSKGRVMDFSGRQFVGEGISAFQYALAAQDIPMSKMLLQYFPKMEEGEATVAWQYGETLEMLQNEKAENHRAVKNLNGSIDDVHQKLGAFFAKYKGMRHDEFKQNEEVATQEWCVVVGGAYRKVPAWVVLTMCEVGENVAWLKKDLTMPVKRECAHLVWLFDSAERSVGSYGAGLVPVRGEVAGACWALWAEAAWRLWPCALFDREVLTKCQSVRPGELPKLESLYSGDESRSTSSAGPAP